MGFTQISTRSYVIGDLTADSRPQILQERLKRKSDLETPDDSLPPSFKRRTRARSYAISDLAAQPISAVYYHSTDRASLQLPVADLRTVTQVCRLSRDVAASLYFHSMGLHIEQMWLRVNAQGCLALPLYAHMTFFCIPRVLRCDFLGIGDHNLTALKVFLEALRGTLSGIQWATLLTNVHLPLLHMFSIDVECPPAALGDFLAWHLNIGQVWIMPGHTPSLITNDSSHQRHFEEDSTPFNPNYLSVILGITQHSIGIQESQLSFYGTAHSAEHFEVLDNECRMVPAKNLAISTHCRDDIFKIKLDYDLRMKLSLMLKRASMSGIDLDKLRKRTKMYLDLNAESSDEHDDMHDDQDDMEDESFLISDHDDDDLVLPTPLQDEAAWNIFEEYLTTDMTFPQMEAKLTSHLGDCLRKSSHRQGSAHVIARKSYGALDYPYDRLGVEFSDDPKSYAHWESVLDDITEADSLDEKRESAGVVPTSALPTWLITVPSIPGWYRPTCGHYWSDVGYGHSYDPESNTITLLVPSRSLHVPKSDIRQDPCMPCLFNSPGGEIIYKDGGHTYIHGLLSLKLTRTAVVEIAIPTPQDILIHKESGCNPALVQSTWHAYAAQHWMQDDLVRITAGELRNCLGKIICVDMATHSASIYMEESLHVGKVSSTPLMFPIANLERKFHVGDNVRVLTDSIEALNLKEKTGIVVEVGIEDNSVVFTVRTYCLATYINESSNLSPGDASVYHHDNPMKGDYVIVVDGVYHLQFGEITEVDLVTQSLAFLSSELGMLLVPIRETAFNPNPTALRYTNERGYDVVAGDTVRVVRGERLHLSGTVLHVNFEKKDINHPSHALHKVHYIHHWRFFNVQEGFSIENMLSGILLSGVRLPLNLHINFNNLVRASFIRAPHVEPPRTPRPSHPPVVSCSDQPADPVIGSSWDAPAESVLHHLSTPPDCWTIDEEDLTEPRTIPPSGGLSTSPGMITAASLAAALHDPRIVKLFFDWHMKFRIVKTHTAVWYSSYLDHLIDTLVPNPFVPPQGPVKEGEIAVRYSSRTSNKGMKVDTIPVEVLVPEPPMGPNKTFTLIRGDHAGTIFTMRSAPKKSTEIITTEGKRFTRADTCIVIKRDV
ncbi:uncharacterized protein F5147DRAFT_652726 [Suillus discolor]|uniref:KOW domain-containing protein n=1 Tax=Suillus discolor TaxID=1912936 RepID=A0A9P7JTZ6_9AGAM|nr:uncharacterized protein F5147DRAFT_652726 [Suillus discolor]KAG2108738.1 hypothetical protein F5147DRAFT_652726 [Suillus discolor]